MKSKPFANDLYVISDSVEVLRKAVEDGAAIVQLRDKSTDRQAITEKARSMVAFKDQKPFVFIVNDDPEMAVEVGADGVHVGQDMATAEVRRTLGHERILGKTTHNLEQAIQAVREGADYISVGPVYATPTKPGRPAVGLAYVKEAAENLRIPFVAIGGIDLSNIDDVLRAGAKTVGVVRAWTDARELFRRIRGIGAKEQVKVTINGSTVELPHKTTVMNILLSYNLKPESVVAVINDQVVQRDSWEQTAITEGDRVELVSLVGGG